MTYQRSLSWTRLNVSLVVFCWWTQENADKICPISWPLTISCIKVRDPLSFEIIEFQKNYRITYYLVRGKIKFTRCNNLFMWRKCVEWDKIQQIFKHRRLTINVNFIQNVKYKKKNKCINWECSYLYLSVHVYNLRSTKQETANDVKNKCFYFFKLNIFIQVHFERKERGVCSTAPTSNKTSIDNDNSLK